MTDAPLLVDIDQNGTGWVTLNRPDVHNAFDDVLIAELTAALERLGTDRAVRAVALRAAGKSFSAGGDLNWMRRMAGYSPDENRRDAEGLAAMLGTLSHCAKPTLALVQGAVLGGGVGLVAACDIALAAEEATFCLSEVKLGLIPATIGPYVIAAVGERQARRYALTAERFDAMEAMRIGLVHEVVPGTTVYAGPNVKHKIVNDGDDELKLMWTLMPGGLEDFFQAVGRDRKPGEPAPEPFPRPENVEEIEAQTVFSPGSEKV